MKQVSLPARGLTGLRRATRIWIDGWNEGAVYSPDGMLIQFDNGTIWERDLGPPPPPARRRR